MTEAEADDLLTSLTRHFLAGNANLSPAQYDQHKATGRCPQCAEGTVGAAAADLAVSRA